MIDFFPLSVFFRLIFSCFKKKLFLKTNVHFDLFSQLILFLMFVRLKVKNKRRKRRKQQTFRFFLFLQTNFRHLLRPDILRLLFFSQFSPHFVKYYCSLTKVGLPHTVLHLRLLHCIAFLKSLSKMQHNGKNARVNGCG
jgi:hypothetical protein